jgi:shikimate kinase
MQNIFLVGPMGSGKTTIGRQLATRLGKQFYDSDGEIEKRTGADISLIFEIEGEEGFRQREAKMIEELTMKEDILLATGGGAVLSEVNRQLLKKRGYVIYLKSSAERLIERTAKDRKRPLLNTDDRKTTIVKMLEVRAPLYEEVADLIIKTDNNAVKQIVNEISQQLDLL